MDRKPRRRIIGPFFLIAIILSAALFMWQKRQNARQAAQAGPPVVERQVIDTPLTESVPPPDLVRSHADELGLQPAQIRRLDPLVASYLSDLNPLQQQLGEANLRLEAYQRKAQDRKQVPTAEIQEQMSEVSQISGRMVSLRQSYWQKLAAILNPDQQARARELWRGTLTRGNSHDGKQIKP